MRPVGRGGGVSGLFVTFEGVDGAGKSTQLRRAAERLRAKGVPALATREPGGSPGAEEIRALLVSGEPGRWSPETELLLFNAARRDHLERTILPALARGDVVLCDRYIDSTRAYQAVARGGDAEMVEALHRLAIGRDPDLTLIFDLEPSLAEMRRAPEEAAGPRAAETRFERFGPSFQADLRAAFRAIAQAEPARCRLIDASGDEAAVTALVDEALAAALSRQATD